MNITYKKPEEITILREGGKILTAALERVRDAVAPGVLIARLDDIAREYLITAGGKPAFLGYGKRREMPGFPATLCVSINDEVVHGAGNRSTILKEGDIVGLDIGVEYKGLFTDMAITVGVGSISKESRHLLNITQAALMNAIDVVRPGAWTKDISVVTQRTCEENGFGVVRDLTGHGVGYALHEDPPIFCYWNNKLPNVQLKEGMVICIEPMVTEGDWHVKIDDDRWTIRTMDGSRSAHFEHTIAVTKSGYEILTLI